MLYQKADLIDIDNLVNSSHPISSEGGNRPSHAIRQKRPRKQQRSLRDTTIDSDPNEASDEADFSSDSTMELPLQKRRGKHPSKRQKMMASTNSTTKVTTAMRVQKRRKLETPIDWDDSWWATQKMPVDLSKLINECKETKETRRKSDPCPVLSHFGAGWSPVLKCIFCIEHSRLVPGESFRAHFGGAVQHPGAFPGTTRYIFITASAFHLAECYPVIRNQTYSMLQLSLPAQLQEPLPMKNESDTLAQRYKCPQNGCDAWVATTKGRGRLDSELERHIGKTHNKTLEAFNLRVLPEWTQRVAVGQGNSSGSTHCFTFPETFHLKSQTTCSRVFPTADLSAPSTDTWPTLLGWEEYVNEITPLFSSRGDAIAKLCDLVALPSRRRISTTTGSERILEHCLFISHKENLAYLEDAETWVSSTDGLFQAHFKHGRYVQLYCFWYILMRLQEKAIQAICP